MTVEKDIETSGANASISTEPHNSVSPSGPDNSETKATAGTTGLLTEWFKSHVGLLQQSSKLVAADVRLAATSTVQLGVLGLIAGIILVCTWLVLMLAIGIFLIWAGVSTGVAVIAILILHGILLLCTLLAIRSTLKGLRFTASRKFISLSTTQSE